jgi:hypothetical protein
LVEGTHPMSTAGVTAVDGGLAICILWMFSVRE